MNLTISQFPRKTVQDTDLFIVAQTVGLSANFSVSLPINAMLADIAANSAAIGTLGTDKADLVAGLVPVDELPIGSASARGAVQVDNVTIVVDSAGVISLSGTGTVISVNGRSGAVVLTKADVGLSNVPNVDATNATNIAVGTLNVARLPTQVTLEGNNFNGASQLVKLNTSTQLPAVDGSLLTNLNGSVITTGLIPITVIPNTVTKLGNAVNGPNQLVMLDGAARYPALNSGITVVTDPTTSSLSSLDGALANIFANAGTGSVTSVSVASANGFAGTVANPTITPAITLTTTASGILKGSGGVLMAASIGDYPTLNQSTTGNAATSSNLLGGTAGSIPFQTAANTTAMLAAGTGVLIGGATPSYTTTPTLVGTNFSGIPNGATTATSTNAASTIVARDAFGNFSAGTITATLTGSATSATTASNITGGAINAIPYQTAVGVTGFITNAVDSVLVTNSGGFPLLSNTLPAVNGSALISLNASNISSGTISSNRLPIATTGVVGAVKPDGTTVTITSGGVISAVGGGGGAVSSVSVVTANGFSGSVANATTTPAITIGTDVTGMLKGNGTAMSAATAGTDFSAGTAALATGILKTTTTTGALSIAVAGDFPTLNQNTSGNAATATNLSGGLNGQIPFQVGANTTAFSNAATPSQVFVSSVTGVPQWSSTVASANLPIATTGAIGGVKPDGTTITINGSGVISAVGGASSTQKFSIPGGAIPKVAGGGGGGANSLVWATAPNPVIDVFNFTNNSNWGMALGNVTGITPSTNISLTMNANVLASQSLAASQNFQLAYAIYGIANGTLVPVASGSTNSATLPVGGMCNLTFTSTAAPVGFTCTQLVVSFNATLAGATQNNYGIPCFDYTLTLS